MKTAIKKTTASKSKSGNTGTAANKTTTAKATAKTTSKTTAKGTVKAKPSAAEGLRELFVDSLKDIYWAEKALVKALPKMAKNATSQNLITAINDHLAVTEKQVARLEEVFKSVGEKAAAKKCDAMEGLIKEGESIMEETESGPVRDAGIIAASQKIEHYEIATYGTLAAFATTLGEDDAVLLLEKTLAEEKEADVLLTEAAYNTINFDAKEEDQK
ncbi:MULTISPECIES: YciE/YciF ferroxidase family protein [Flavobacterium]|uniref:Ferritin-like domain-containing protein n=1 Tax=Flavobacterium panici TaxID=2654843 RepID=A0A9N8J6P4_9FLAO|nr:MULTISPECIES: ferritin-like domain-containing protein [Flavobacterium]UUF13035.1 ferritin-like domain-containing protein [Flavobacterium panici]CAC9976137.1 ferritin-like domain-containing protein [Flavobacterium panici]